MSIYNIGPPRGGTRGGQAHFSWETVKNDKYRENYLGHSLHAATGRWQQGRDLQWWNKANKGSSKNDVSSESAVSTLEKQRKKELDAIKAAEKDALAEALGFQVEKRVETNVTQAEVEQVIQSTEASSENMETGLPYSRKFLNRQTRAVPSETEIENESKNFSSEFSNPRDRQNNPLERECDDVTRQYSRICRAEKEGSPRAINKERDYQNSTKWKDTQSDRDHENVDKDVFGRVKRRRNEHYDDNNNRRRHKERSRREQWERSPLYSEGSKSVRGDSFRLSEERNPRGSHQRSPEHEAYARSRHESSYRHNPVSSRRGSGDNYSKSSSSSRHHHGETQYDKRLSR